MSWKTRELGEFAVTRGGAVDPSSHLSEEFDLYSIPAYDSRVPELAKGSQIGSSKKVVQPRDVLISRIVPHIRRAWIVGSDNGRRLIASGEWIIFRSEELWPNYLRHFLLSDPFHVQFMQTVSGVGGSLLRARPAEVYKIKIPLPPLDEQKRIAAILDAADELRTKRRESLAQLDTLLQSTFLDLFGDPVTNPKEWPTMRFNEVGRFVSGATPSKARKDYWEGTTPWVSPKDMKVPRIYDAIDHVSQAAFRESNLKRLDGRHLLIVVRGMILAHSFPTALNEVTIAINQDMKGIYPAECFDVFFLKACVDNLKRQILAEVSNAGHGTKRLDAEGMSRIAVPCPPMGLQQEFAAILTEADQQRDRYERQLTELDTLFASLQFRAFRGEL